MLVVRNIDDFPRINSDSISAVDVDGPELSTVHSGSKKDLPLPAPDDNDKRVHELRDGPTCLPDPGLQTE